MSTTEDWRDKPFGFVSPIHEGENDFHTWLELYKPTHWLNAGQTSDEWQDELVKADKECRLWTVIITDEDGFEDTMSPDELEKLAEDEDAYDEAYNKFREEHGHEICDWWFSPGWHYVNRDAYVICEVPFDVKNTPHDFEAARLDDIDGVTVID